MSPSDLPAPPPALFPDATSRTRVDDALTRALLAAGERVAHGSVIPTVDREKLRRELAQFDFAVPRSLDELMKWTIERLEHGVVHMNHPRYFGLFNPAANFPAQCADRIAGAFNPQLASSGSSPAPVEIEAHVIRAIARRAGSSARSRLTLKLEQPLEQRLDRGNRAEIVRRDVLLRDAQVKLPLHREHQIHHLDGAHTKLAQARVHGQRLPVALIQNLSDERQEARTQYRGGSGLRGGIVHGLRQ